MVYRKRSYSKRKRTIKRRPMNVSRPRRMMRSNNPVARFKRTFYTTTLTPSTGATSGFWQYSTITLSDLPNVTEYTALFDQYKINAVKVTFRPRYDNFAGNDTVDTTLPGTTAQGMTRVHVINDPDSTLTPTGAYTSATLNSFLEQGNVRTYDGTKPFSVYYRPKIVNSLTTGTNNIRAPWINTSSPSVSHRGFHYFMQDVNLTGTFNQAFDIFVTMYFMCKNSK